MTSAVRNRPLDLVVVWGLALAVVPVAVMTDPYGLTDFLVVALLCAAVSGVVGTLVAGGRTSERKGTRSASALRGLEIGAVQGLVGGALAALLLWAVIWC